MVKNGKKYVLRESELRDIIREMILMEAYNANDYKTAYTKNWDGKPIQGKDLWNTAKGVISSVPEIFAPGSTEKVMAGNNPFLRGLYNLLGANGAAGNPDWIYNVGQKPGTTPNADAHEVLDVNRACQWIIANAHPKSTNWCARHVRCALNYGGLGVPHTMGTLAKNAAGYLKILPANGWDKIPVSEAGQPGDVCVIAPHAGHPAGHISMCVGGGRWISDFTQKTMHGLKVPPPAGTVYVFRYRNRK